MMVAWWACSVEQNSHSLARFCQEYITGSPWLTAGRNGDSRSGATRRSVSVGARRELRGQGPCLAVHRGPREADRRRQMGVDLAREVPRWFRHRVELGDLRVCQVQVERRQVRLKLVSRTRRPTRNFGRTSAT